MKEYVAYTDGSYDMDSHYGASAVVILDEAERRIILQRAAARLCLPTEEKQQFCQEQELGACIRALTIVPQGSSLTIKTDSQYCCKVLSGEWNANTNLDIIDRFFEVQNTRQIRVQFVKVKGHSGDKWNELADELCTKARLSLQGGGPAVLQQIFTDFL